jgi:hypothetical protein
VGSYQYTITQPSDVVLPAKEATHGMSLVSPCASTVAPAAAWFANMTAFMDRCAEVGFMVHFQLNAFQKKGNDPATLGNMTTQITWRGGARGEVVKNVGRGGGGRSGVGSGTM